MHILGVTHNDIKPANIVYKDGFKLLDFDITTYS
jgi:serine/threonine protein kinase